MVTTSTGPPVQSGKNAMSYRAFALACGNQGDTSGECVSSIPISRGRLWRSLVTAGDVNLGRNTREIVGNERVTFLRGVYRVRMRGVLRSFAYILKRRTFTAPNMLAQREKKRKRKRRKKRRETKIPSFAFTPRVEQREK